MPASIGPQRANLPTEVREFTKSLFSFGLAVSLFGLKQVENVVRDSGAAEKSLDQATGAIAGELGATLDATFHAVDNLQRGLVGLLLR